MINKKLLSVLFICGYIHAEKDMLAQNIGLKSQENLSAKTLDDLQKALGSSKTKSIVEALKDSTAKSIISKATNNSKRTASSKKSVSFDSTEAIDYLSRNLKGSQLYTFNRFMRQYNKWKAIYADLTSKLSVVENYSAQAMEDIEQKLHALEAKVRMQSATLARTTRAIEKAEGKFAPKQVRALHSYLRVSAPEKQVKVDFFANINASALDKALDLYQKYDLFARIASKGKLNTKKSMALKVLSKQGLDALQNVTTLAHKVTKIKDEANIKMAKQAQYDQKLNSIEALTARINVLKDLQAEAKSKKQKVADLVLSKRANASVVKAPVAEVKAKEVVKQEVVTTQAPVASTVEVKALEQKIADMEAKLSAANADKADIQSKFGAEKTSLEKKLADAKDEVNLEKGKVNSLEDNKKQLEKDLNDKRTEAGTWVGIKHNLETEKANLTSANENLKKEKATLEKDKQDLQAENKNVQEQLEQKTKSLTETRDALDKLRSDITGGTDAKNKTIADLSQQLVYAKKAKEEAATKAAEEAKKAKTEADDKVADLKQQLTADKAAADGEKSRLEAELADANKNVTELTTKLTDAKKDKEDLEAATKAKEEAATKAAEEAKKAKTEADDKAAALQQQLTADKAAADAEKSRLEAELADANKNVTELTTKLTDAQTEAATKANEAAAKVAELEKQLDEANKAAAAADANRIKLNNELEDVKKQLKASQSQQNTQQSATAEVVDKNKIEQMSKKQDNELIDAMYQVSSAEMQALVKLLEPKQLKDLMNDFTLHFVNAEKQPLLDEMRDENGYRKFKDEYCRYNKDGQPKQNLAQVRDVILKWHSALLDAFKTVGIDHIPNYSLVDGASLQAEFKTVYEKIASKLASVTDDSSASSKITKLAKNIFFTQLVYADSRKDDNNRKVPVSNIVKDLLRAGKYKDVLLNYTSFSPSNSGSSTPVVSNISSQVGTPLQVGLPSREVSNLELDGKDNNQQQEENTDNTVSNTITVNPNNNNQNDDDQQEENYETATTVVDDSNSNNNVIIDIKSYVASTDVAYLVENFAKVASYLGNADIRTVIKALDGHNKGFGFKGGDEGTVDCNRNTLTALIACTMSQNADNLFGTDKAYIQAAWNKYSANLKYFESKFNSNEVTTLEGNGVEAKGNKALLDLFKKLATKVNVTISEVENNGLTNLKAYWSVLDAEFSKPSATAENQE